MIKGDSQKYNLTYEETTFWGLLKTAGLKEFANWSMLYSIMLTVFIVSVVYSKDPSLFLSLSKDLSPTLLGASATIFGIVLAALAVSVSLFHNSLLPALLESKLLHKYLFPFWKAVSIWGFAILVNLLLIILVEVEFDFMCTTKWLFIFSLFLFLYATFYTVSLTGLVIRLTLQRAQLKLDE